MEAESSAIPINNIQSFYYYIKRNAAVARYYAPFPRPILQSKHYNVFFEFSSQTASYRCRIFIMAEECDVKCEVIEIVYLCSERKLLFGQIFWIRILRWIIVDMKRSHDEWNTLSKQGSRRWAHELLCKWDQSTVQTIDLPFVDVGGYLLMRATTDRSNLLSFVHSFIHVPGLCFIFLFFSNAKYIKLSIFKASMDFCFYRPGLRRFIPTNNRQKAAIFHWSHLCQWLISIPLALRLCHTCFSQSFSPTSNSRNHNNNKFCSMKTTFFQNSEHRIWHCYCHKLYCYISYEQMSL